MKAKKFFLRWEWLLALLIVGTYAFFSNKMPGVYTFDKLLDQTRVYMVDVGFMALGAMLILILGEWFYRKVNFMPFAGLAAEKGN